MTPRIPTFESSARGDGLDDIHHSKVDAKSATLPSSSIEDLQFQTFDERWSEGNIENAVKRWSLNETEEQRLRELKRRLTDVDHWKNNPMEIVRYLRGPGKYEDVEGKFREMIAWRHEAGADRLLEEYRPPRTLLYYIPSAILKGLDKDGDPIYLERGGAIDGVGLQRYPQEDIVKHIVWLREIGTRGPWIRDYEKCAGRTPSQVTIIYDMQGMSSRHLKPGVFPLFKSIVQINQRRYCGLAKRIIILRAPSIFTFLWSIAKHLFPPEGQKLMVFTGPSDYLQVLDKYVDREVLPPCICKEGKGSAIDCMPQNFEGGILPHNAEVYIPDEPWITHMVNTAETMRRREQERLRHVPRAQPKQTKPSVIPVCLSNIQNVQVLNVPDAHLHDEYEAVLSIR